MRYRLSPFWKESTQNSECQGLGQELQMQFTGQEEAKTRSVITICSRSVRAPTRELWQWLLMPCFGKTGEKALIVLNKKKMRDTFRSLLPYCPHFFARWTFHVTLAQKANSVHNRTPWFWWRVWLFFDMHKGTEHHLEKVAKHAAEFWKEHKGTHKGTQPMWNRMFAVTALTLALDRHV